VLHLRLNKVLTICWCEFLSEIKEKFFVSCTLISFKITVQHLEMKFLGRVRFILLMFFSDPIPL